MTDLEELNKSYPKYGIGKTGIVKVTNKQEESKFLNETNQRDIKHQIAVYLQEYLDGFLNKQSERAIGAQNLAKNLSAEFNLKPFPQINLEITKKCEDCVYRNLAGCINRRMRIHCTFYLKEE
ncbi:MAG: hypothetical protein ACXAC8_17620 [Candidatus Hodarchaeales archaeon]|jgi:hypothetical protein